MFRSYLKAALRSSARQKGYTLINVVGLALGMAVCVLLALWVIDELSYDRFHANFDNLYRLTETFQQGDVSETSAIVSVPLGLAIRESIPQVARLTQVHVDDEKLIKCGEISFQNDVLAYADPVFLDMFSFPLLKGDPSAALSERFSVIVTESMGRKYFGEDDPLGKVLNIDRRDFQVTGVMADLPRNSHLQFDCLAPFSAREDYIRQITDENWEVSAFSAYVQLHVGADVAEVARLATDLSNAHHGSGDGHTSEIGLQHIGHIHLHPEVEDYQEGHGDARYVYLFSTLAVLTLLVACINFMNLATARAGRRAGEVAVRKVIGALRTNLIGQFYGESLVLVGLALVVALGLVEIALPVLNFWTGKELNLLAQGVSPALVGLFAVALLTGLIAGSYPAVLLSSFRPTRALQAAKGGSVGGRTFRRVLVGFQLALAMGLLICSAVVFRQMYHVNHLDLGYDKDDLIYFTTRGSMAANFEAAKQELEEQPSILAVTGGAPPVRWLDPAFDISWDGKPDDLDVVWQSLPLQPDYLKVLGISVKEGRDFSSELVAGPEQGFIINETAARLMGTASPVGKRFKFGAHDLLGHLDALTFESTIIGVAEDFHVASLHRTVGPVVMYVNPSQVRRMCVRYREGEASQALAAIKSVWDQYAADFMFEPEFADATVNRYYQSERNLGVVLYAFTGLALIITCLGLLGLVAFAAERRTREIGVRKVLGASVPGIVALLSREFILLGLLAGVVACPVTFMIMRVWLQRFAYRVEFGPGIPAIAVAIVLAATLLTVSVQSVRAAAANPIASLKYE